MIGVFSLLALKPLMTLPAELVFELPKESATLAKEIYGVRQSTRWSLSEGILSGAPSTPEFQASRKDHKGLEPRIAFVKTPQDFAASFRIRFSGGTFTKLPPFIEFGHHKARFSFGRESISLDADSGAAKLGSSSAAKFEDGHTYEVYAEQRGEDVLLQVDGQCTLFGSHPSLKTPTAKGAAGLGICGTNGGKVEISELRIWSIRDGEQPGWPALRRKLAGN